MAPPRQPAMTTQEWAKGISDLGDSQWSANILIHGAPGCGKTALLSALPDCLMLACDPGYVTAVTLRRKAKVRPISSERELIAGIEWLEAGGHSNYRWVFLDGGNILQQKMTLANARDAWTANNASRASAHQPDKPDYGKQQNTLKTAVARLCDLPVNVVFTFHSTLLDEEGGEWRRPQIEGREYKVGSFVCGLMSSIGYMAVREKMRIVKRDGEEYEEPTGEMVRKILWEQRHNADTGVTIMAKDQLNVFPPVMNIPNGMGPEAGQQIHELVMSIGSPE